ncbi:MAG: NAD(P)H-dependent oxidoreductase [Gemmatimonadaceae bacterium]|nr:NAD(P)H-dependent oxidoreductase [Acetobacteraceae bacterium]
MATLLHIDASVRSDRSLSRALSRAFVDRWTAHRPADAVLRRDVGAAPPPYIDGVWIAAVWTPSDRRTEAQRLALAASDELIAELEAADVVVIGTPMHNYGMPAMLKAWIDQVIRVGRTYSYDLARGDWPLAPLLSGKSLVLLTSSGEFGFAPGGIREGWNHLDTHVRTLSGYLGAATFHHIGIEYQGFGDEQRLHSVAAAHARIPQLVEEVAAVTNCGSGAGERSPATIAIDGERTDDQHRGH